MSRSAPLATRFGSVLSAGYSGGAIVVALSLLLGGCAGKQQVTDPGAGSPRFDGLVPLENARVAMAYIDPDADFSVYRRVAIMEPQVAFRRNWQRDQNRSGSRRVGSNEMERIRTDVASLLREVFAQRLQANDGYEVVNERGHDVLLLHPAIVDLDITAPDTQTAGRSSTLTAGAGAATLYIELFDSVSGDIIGRAADRQVARSSGTRLSWSNGVTNTADARRMFGRWADQLRAFLDEHYLK